MAKIRHYHLDSGERHQINALQKLGLSVRAIAREWFFVPLHVIDDVAQKIIDGTITKYCHDANSASLLKLAATA